MVSSAVEGRKPIAPDGGYEWFVVLCSLLILVIVNVFLMLEESIRVRVIRSKFIWLPLLNVDHFLPKSLENFQKNEMLERFTFPKIFLNLGNLTLPDVSIECATDLGIIYEALQKNSSIPSSFISEVLVPSMHIEKILQKKFFMRKELALHAFKKIQKHKGE